jgi:Ca2+-binding RTX toxin-like protein
MAEILNRINGTNSDDTLVGSNGADAMYGEDGDDTLTGGSGDDYVNGGYGNDTYYFKAGDGKDTIDDFGFQPEIDKLIFSGLGLTASNAIVTRIPGTDDLKISFAGKTDSIVLSNQLSSGFNNRYGIESVQFSDGIKWTESQLWDAYLRLAPDTNDRLSGNLLDNVILGGLGDDAIYGDDGDDTLTGGLGNDYVNGGYGNDTYYFNAGDGKDVIDDFGFQNEIDKLIFSGPGLTASNAIVTRIPGTDDLKISFVDKTDSITLSGQLSSGFNNRYGVESVQFSDGTKWTESQLWDAYLRLALDTNDRLSGNLLDNVILGGLGDDAMYGEDGDDALTGGLGNDYVNGGYGNDTYYFNAGDGKDVIDDFGFQNEIDKLVFSGAGLIASNAIVTRTPGTDDLKISFVDKTDSITLSGQLSSGFNNRYGIESVQFSDGTTWTESQLWDAYLRLALDTNDRLSGNLLDNIILGGLGDDAMYGEDGDDALTGGLGNDYINGGYGNDTYYFNAGDGKDVIDDFGFQNEIDKLIFSGTGLTASNAIVARIPGTDDLKISFVDKTDSITLSNQLSSGFNNWTVQSY